VPLETASARSATTTELRQEHELCRPATWDRLTEERRTTLLAPYGAALEALSAQPEIAAGSDALTQAWVADFTAVWLQRTAVEVIQGWLADAAPDAHLVVTGEQGHGRLSVVATLARRAMATQPAPPDYCYLPNPDDLTRSILLTLPPHTADPFAFLAEAGRQQALSDWAKLRAEHAEGHAEGGENGEEGAKPSVASYFAPALEAAPTLARAALARLLATLEGRLGMPFPPPMSEIEAPVAHMRVRGEEMAAEGESESPTVPTAAGVGAPVITCTRTPQDPARLILRANGGVLIVAADVLLEREQASQFWLALRSILRTGMISWKGAGSPSIPISLRIVVVGTDGQYYDLRRRAEDFGRFFRYKAPFETDVLWSEAGAMAPQAEAAYAALAEAVARRYGLLPLDPSGVGRLVEEGARRVGDRQRMRLTANLVALHDLAVEAGHFALERAGGMRVPELRATRADVEAIVERRREQQSSLGRLLRERLLAGREVVPTTGAAIGQINGLTVYSPRPIEGQVAVPFRISATVSPGRERFVDIEREAETGDESHVSGALTMEGYLAHRYGSQRQINVVARLRFEQEHGVTSGDSASAGVLFALLSALAEVPIYSARAITGAVGQYGELQTIGSVNTKIEGFWEICHQRRDAGERPEISYGILVPVANTQDLMLRREVARSIAEDGWFHVWPISTVDEGIPLLTNLVPDEFHARVDRRLQRFYELAVPPTIRR
jgi:predicted ATP-dependent protease